MVDARRLSISEVAEVLPDLARLRIKVFRDWPYLYDGDLSYEENYLQPYAADDQAVVIGAYDEGRLVGASTGMPLLKHDEDFAAAFKGNDFDLQRLFYCAESVLLPQYRGQGLGHVFFDIREEAARKMGCTYCAFCAVERPSDHPARPAEYRPLDTFWLGRGYKKLQGIEAQFHWKDLGEKTESIKSLQFWGRPL